ncbi:MAG: hypothetical protein AAFX54_00425 [Pseudomonadota bacterium]
MDIVFWYLYLTFGLPAFGVILLAVAGLISATIFLRRRAGHEVDVGHPKVLMIIGISLIVLPTVYFFIVLQSLQTGAG